MKKIFTLLSLLFAFVGAANAQESPVTSTGDLDNAAAYSVQSARGYFVYNSTDGLAWNSGHNNYSGTAVTDAAAQTFAQWGFYKSDATGRIYMYNVASQTFLENDGSNASLVATPTAGNITFLTSTGSTASTYPTVIAFGSAQINMSKDTRYGLLTTWNSTSDEGNMLAITKVADIAEDVKTAIAAKIAAFEVSYIITPDNAKVYNISTAARGSWCYVAGVSETNLTATCISGATDASDRAKEFAIITGTNGLYIYSVAAGKFVSIGEGSQGYSGTALTVAPRTSNTQLITYSDDAYAPYPQIVSIDSKHIGISDWYSAANGYTNIDGIISFWNDVNDAGNQVRITEVEDASYNSSIPVARVALYEGIAAASANIGTAYGTLAADEAYTTALAAANTALDNADATAEDLTTALTTLQSAYAALSYNVPQAGAFIRIKSYNAANQYLGATNHSETVNNSERAAYVTTDNALDPATLFYYDGKYIVNYSNGYYLTAVTTSGNHAAYQGIAPDKATIVAFKKQTSYTGTDGGKYNVTFYNGSRYLYAKDEGYADAGNDPNAKGYTFDIEEVNQLPLTITAAGYATLYAPCALSIPGDVTVYTVSNFTGTRAILEEVTGGEIPAGTGVVVKGEAGTYNFDILSSTGATTGTNQLTGSYPAVAVAADTKTFVLSNKSKGVGFYLLSDNTDDDATKRNVAGFRAFYQPADDGNSEAAPAFIFSIGGVSGIEAVDAADAADAAIYDLSGRRVQKAAKGLYIQNGKKVYVK